MFIKSLVRLSHALIVPMLLISISFGLYKILSLVARAQLSSGLLELLEKLCGLEVLRDGFVVALDDLVDLLLPARLGVLALTDREEELAKGHFNDRGEMVRNLEEERKRTVKTQPGT